MRWCRANCRWYRSRTERGSWRGLVKAPETSEEEMLERVGGVGGSDGAKAAGVEIGLKFGDSASQVGDVAYFSMSSTVGLPPDKYRAEFRIESMFPATL